MADRGDVLWRPAPDARGHTRLGRYMDWLAAERGLSFAGYDDLWRWSVTDVEAFWRSIWDHFALVSATPVGDVLAGGDRAMPGARWFPGATLNYAEHALRLDDGGGAVGPRAPDGPALLAWSQARGPMEVTRAELRRRVARCRAGLARLGVGRGDRVAAYLPNVPEAIVAFLATASLGAVWASCAPEFGTRSVVDRLSQVAPTVLLAVDGYRYGTKDVDRAAEVAAIRAALPSVTTLVTVPYLDPSARLAGSVTWDELLGDGDDVPGGTGAAGDDVPVEHVPFDHPLYVLFSSGTTGLPKPITHGHGGITLEHHKVLALHNDLGPGDRFLWFTTTGWMMWNYLTSGLLVGAALVLFDGDPGSPDLGALWRLAGDAGVTFFGTSAPFLLACRSAGVVPADEADLTALRTIGSTGAPLPPEGFDWVAEAVGTHVPVSSVSGGTDVCTAFVGGTPLVPVRRGEISCRYLGAAVEAFAPDGTSLVGAQGELVVTQPLPSMPVGFWGDEDGSRYRAAYFADHPGAWAHGDWVTVFEDGACVITGRSDATLNRGGVRMGTAELYSVVEAFDEVADSLVVHLEDGGAGGGATLGGAGRLVLFVQLAAGVELDDDLRRRLAAALRRDLSPRHVPDEVHAVPGVPRTLSGKKLEVPVKRILAGADPDVAASRGSLANPEVLDAYAGLARPAGRPAG